MPDHWNFVAAAYALAILLLGGYWRRLVRRERDLMLTSDQRSRRPSMSRPPRPDAASRHSRP